MKIFKPIGSREKLFDLMGKVNKIVLNENISEFENQTSDSVNLLNTAFTNLVNNNLTVQRSDIQTSGNESFVMLECLDNQGNKIVFRFKLNANRGDQEGVYGVNNVELINFTHESKINGNSTVIDEDGLKQFNAQHSSDLLDVVSDYADFEEKEPEIDEEYENIVKKIDSYPFGGGSERMQTGIGYGDEKPVNPNVRVDAPELKKFVDEESGIQKYSNASTKYYENLPTNTKRDVILTAKAYVDAELKKRGMLPREVPYEQYMDEIKRVAIIMYEKFMAHMNEEEESEYPDPIGKKFKSKNKYPKSKRKPKTTVNIDEEEDTGMKFNPKTDDIEQLSREKEETGEILKGGKADGKLPLEFDPDQILKGMKVEMEHTTDPMEAIEIVMDHLTEDPEYYTTKDNPEKSAQANAASDVEKNDSNDDTMTDTLLGYKPKNVGETFDYTNDDGHKKYLEYMQKDFNELSDDEKDEFFELWKQYKETKSVGDTINEAQVRTKLFKIGEYAVGGIIKIEIKDQFITISALDWNTKQFITGNEFGLNEMDSIQTYLNELTSSYYADKIMEWINVNGGMKQNYGF